MIKGETVVLVQKTMTGKDAFNVPIYSESQVSVDDVIIGTPSTEQAINELNLHGKRIAFVLGIPKGDTHNWVDTDVYIRNVRFHTYGFPLTQTDDNVPGAWNTQVKVELYG